MNQAGMSARVESNIHAARLEKLLVSLAINPLTAVYKVLNGAVLDAPLRAEVEKLVREAWPVLQAEGLRLTEEEALAKVLAVADATAANRSSMLQDVRAGRRTEADYILARSSRSPRNAAPPCQRIERCTYRSSGWRRRRSSGLCGDRASRHPTTLSGLAH